VNPIFLGTGHYLSPGGVGGFLVGDRLILRRTEGGITENFGRIQRGDNSNLLEQWNFESIQNKYLHSTGR